jgi:hypothetical protein
MIEIARDSRSVALSTTRGSASMRVIAATFTAVSHRDPEVNRPCSILT